VVPCQKLDLVEQTRHFRKPADDVTAVFVKVLFPPPCASKSASASSVDLRRLSHTSLWSAQSARAHCWLQYDRILQRPQYRCLHPGPGRKRHLEHKSLPTRAGGVLSAVSATRSTSGSASPSASRRSCGMAPMLRVAWRVMTFGTYHALSPHVWGVVYHTRRCSTVMERRLGVRGGNVPKKATTFFFTIQ
jgi:hypothetical protein